MSEINMGNLVLEIHSALVADQTVTKKPSPWLGELYRKFCAVADENGAKTIPDRYAVMAQLLRNSKSFRISGDWSDDYQTVWFNPTEVDTVHMQRQERSRNTVLETANIDKNQLHLFEETKDGTDQ
jgi:hypothetical protein